MKVQTRYNKVERALARSLVKSDGIKIALNARIISRLEGKKHIATKVKITGKLKTAAQNRKNSLQENTVANVERLRRDEIYMLKNEYFELTSRQKKKAGTLQQFIAAKATI